MGYQDDIEQGIDLLKLCQRLQSEKDGVRRPDVDVFVDKTKTLDEFAMRIFRAVTYMVSLRQLLPMKQRLGDLGRELERRGKISIAWGDDYAVAALNFVMSEYGMADSATAGDAKASVGLSVPR